MDGEGKPVSFNFDAGFLSLLYGARGSPHDGSHPTKCQISTLIGGVLC